MRFTFSNDLGTLFTIILAIGFIINLVLAFNNNFLETKRPKASSTWARLFVHFV
ncbi:cardiolipin synthase, partial [Staphylococcus aureus]